jgi:SAM-dependent methyltransferase
METMTMHAPTSTVPLDEPALRRNWLDRLVHQGDELDQLAVLEVQKRKRAGLVPAVLDADCGDGAFALRLARSGADVLAIDSGHDGSDLMAAAKVLGIAGSVRFLPWQPGCGNTTPLPGGPFDIVANHRSLSLMPYSQGVAMVRELLLNTRTGGRLYISAYGLHSDFGDHYEHASKPVRERFAPLPPETASRYGIDGPVCLYSERDLFLLMFEAGASVLRTFTTTHGNVKAIGVRV